MYIKVIFISIWAASWLRKLFVNIFFWLYLSLCYEYAEINAAIYILNIRSVSVYSFQILVYWILCKISICSLTFLMKEGWILKLNIENWSLLHSIIFMGKKPTTISSNGSLLFKVESLAHSNFHYYSLIHHYS